MHNNRLTNAKLNIVVSATCQFINIACGFIIPRILVTEFGSELYGATTSIVQFLAYITLIEGGIGGVARAALYKPLAEKDSIVINKILTEVKKFFSTIGLCFIIYVLIIATCFDEISNIECLDSQMTAALVIVISLSTCLEYFIGITNQLFLQAAQKNYIISALNAFTVFLNMLITLGLVSRGSNIIVVKFVSGCIFIIKPIVLYLYVKYKYKTKTVRGEEKYLKDKWTGLGQHIAYFLHSNTDVAVLTVFANLKVVAVYSIYNMIVSQMQKIVLSFTSGMEAFFGDLVAKKEHVQLNNIFSCYELMTSMVSTIVYTVTAALIVPFVLLYLNDVVDINYERHMFSFLIVIAAYMYCLRQPYHKLIMAAGYFKETRVAAYAEVLINILASILLVIKLDLIGVAVGTILAVVFRTCYYIVYVNKNILKRSLLVSRKRYLVNIGLFISSYMCDRILASYFPINSYVEWIVCAVVITCLNLVIIFAINYIFFKKEFSLFLELFIKGR